MSYAVFEFFSFSSTDKWKKRSKRLLTYFNLGDQVFWIFKWKNEWKPLNLIIPNDNKACLGRFQNCRRAPKNNQYSTLFQQYLLSCKWRYVIMPIKTTLDKPTQNCKICVNWEKTNRVSLSRHTNLFLLQLTC